MENKYFKVYEDLIVREIIDKDISNDKNVLGVITYSQSSVSFKPNFFASYKKGKEIFLWEYKLENEIYFTKYFKLDKITELPDDDQSRNYYKFLVFTLIDVFDEKYSFEYDMNNQKFYKEPEYLMTFTDLQKFFLDILNQLKQVKSFEAFHLSNTIKELNKSIESLSPKN